MLDNDATIARILPTKAISKEQNLEKIVARGVEKQTNKQAQLEEDKQNERDHNQSLFRFALIKRLSDKYGLRFPIATVITNLVLLVKKGIKFTPIQKVTQANNLTQNQQDNRREIKSPQIVKEGGRIKQRVEIKENKLIKEETNSKKVKNSSSFFSKIFEKVAELVKSLVKIIALFKNLKNKAHKQEEKENLEDEKKEQEIDVKQQTNLKVKETSPAQESVNNKTKINKSLEKNKSRKSWEERATESKKNNMTIHK